MKRLSLGLDSSTQSMTGVLIDIDNGEIVYSKSLDYASDPRLNCYGINHKEYLVPPREAGEADQPPLMYIASIDALFEDMKKDGIDMSAIKVINTSGQQHGHLYLNNKAKSLFSSLNDAGNDSGDLVSIIGSSFSYQTAPIWKTSNTETQANAIREAVGGKDKMIMISGSDSPLRFTGAVIRRVGEQFPQVYQQTEKIQLISSFIPAVLCGNSEVPIDFGNACGMSLMNYEQRNWSNTLIDAVSSSLPGGNSSLTAKLPDITSPDSIVGSIATYFKEKYGFNECVIAAGSGDNPQTKVLIKGDLLSLGTSFVNMVATDGTSYDMGGFANAMYDGVGRPFMFGCRTNGAMVWDRVRANYGLTKKDYKKAEEALKSAPPANGIFMWQVDNESFPPSKKFDPVRIGSNTGSLEFDYSGIIDSSLAAVFTYSQAFARKTSEPLYITGGPTSSEGIMRRAAGIWGRPVVTIGSVGAGLGTAVAGAQALSKHTKESFDAEQLSASVLPRGKAINPIEDDVKKYKEYLPKFKETFEKYAM
ncbi:MAG: xylulose kinase [Spirochaetes bacterium]|nr:xylulose kinase [Spirochaetota bacterium]MBN2771933.1 xylulose kinase [Spirochaetota bacterium]